MAAEDEYTPTDYIPSSRYDIEQMYEELLGFVRSVENPYIKQLLEAFSLKMKHLLKSSRIHQQPRQYITDLWVDCLNTA